MTEPNNISAEEVDTVVESDLPNERQTAPISPELIVFLLTLIVMLGVLVVKG